MLNVKLYNKYENNFIVNQDFGMYVFKGRMRYLKKK